MSIKNPLRYPGAKSKLYDYICKLLIAEQRTGCTFYEPFAGSAAISLLLLENQVISKAVLNELDPLLYNFWFSVFNHTEELITLIRNTDITLENWHEFSLYRNNDYLQDKTSVQIGFAGLFSLWAAYQTDIFSGVAAASPSVWFPGFIAYMKEHEINSETVYLSLGDREEKTRNPVMSQVGNCIQKGYDWLTKCGINCTLEWNQGNHFREPDIRTAKAFAWVLTEKERMEQGIIYNPNVSELTDE